MALVCASVRLFMDVRVIDYNGGAAIVNVSVPVGIVSNILSAGSSLLTCIASFVLEFRTLVVYRRMSKVFRYQHRDDYRLLFYALLGLIGQSLLAMYYVIIYSVGIVYPQINATAQNAYPYINSLLALGDAVCLFVTSGSLRREYFKWYLPAQRYGKAATNRIFSTDGSFSRR